MSQLFLANALSAQVSTHARSRYRTPPTDTGDDGSVYAVTVTNNLGSVTSDDAILTVE